MKDKIFFDPKKLLLLVVLMHGFVDSSLFAAETKNPNLRQQEAELIKKKKAEELEADKAADYLKDIDSLLSEARKQEEASLKAAPKVTFDPLKKLEAPATPLYQDTIRPRPLTVPPQKVEPTVTAAQKPGVTPEPITPTKLTTIQDEEADAALKQKQKEQKDLEDDSADLVKGWGEDFVMFPQAPITPAVVKQTQQAAEQTPIIKETPAITPAAVQQTKEQTLIKETPATTPGVVKQTKEEAPAITPAVVQKVEPAPYVPYKPVASASAAEIRAATMEQIRAGRIPSLDQQKQEAIQAQQAEKKSTIQSKVQTGLKQIKTTVLDTIKTAKDVVKAKAQTAAEKAQAAQAAKAAQTGLKQIKTTVLDTIKAAKDVVKAKTQTAAEKAQAAKAAQIKQWTEQANPKDPAVKAALDNKDLYNAYKKSMENNDSKYLDLITAQKLNVTQRMELNFGLMGKLNLEKAQAAGEEKILAAKKTLELANADITAKKAAEVTAKEDAALASKISDTKKSLSQADQDRVLDISNKKFIGEEKLTASEEKILKGLDARPEDKRLVEERRSALIERERAVVEGATSGRQAAEGLDIRGAEFKAKIGEESKKTIDVNLERSRQMAQEAAERVAAQKAASTKAMTPEDEAKRAATAAKAADLRKAAEEKAAAKKAEEGITFLKG